MTEVPCIFVEDLTETQKRAYILADNKLALDAGWDDEILKGELKFLQDNNFDITITGFDMDEIDLNATPIEFEEDDFTAEPPAEPKSKVGEIYQLGRHRLMVGDCTDFEAVKELMNGELVDLYLTDPPYNVSLGQNGGHPIRPSEAKQLHRSTDGLIIKNDSFESDEEFVEFLASAFNTALAVMKDGAGIYIWCASQKSYEFLSAFKISGIQLRQQLIWVKNTLTLGRQDYQWKHEPCLYGWKDGAGHYFIDKRNQTTVYEDTEKLQRMSKDELIKLIYEISEDKCPTTIIHENKPCVSELHPTMKPIALIGRLIKNSSRENENVFDGFGGSGSTLIACEQLKRNCFMVELDPKYADVIIDRWEKFTGQKAIKIN